MSRRLVLFAKAPCPGEVKTRLTPTLGAEGASRLYAALLADTVDRLRVVGVPLEIHVAEPGAVAWFEGRYPGVSLRSQEGRDLGARMISAFRGTFDRGHDRVVIVGSDHPTLPPAYLTRAFRYLGRGDAVLGPGRDGGYYAVGIRRQAWPEAAELFRDMPWSTPRVLEASRNAAERASLSVGELPLWYDVDRPEDLALLRRDASPGSHSLRTLRALERGEGELEVGTDRGGARRD